MSCPATRSPEHYYLEPHYSKAWAEICRSRVYSTSWPLLFVPVALWARAWSHQWPPNPLVEWLDFEAIDPDGVVMKECGLFGSWKVVGRFEKSAINVVE